jgi:hypothetical protein
MHRHLNDKIIIEEEGRLQMPELREMFRNHGQTRKARDATGKIEKTFEMKREQTHEQQVQDRRRRAGNC